MTAPRELLALEKRRRFLTRYWACCAIVIGGVGIADIWLVSFFAAPMLILATVSVVFFFRSVKVQRAMTARNPAVGE